MLVMCVRSRPAYFAERLYKSMKGVGTDDSTLVRVIVTRSEVGKADVLVLNVVGGGAPY